MTMIETRGLRKAFGKHVVLDGIDLHVDAGDDLRTARPQRCWKYAGRASAVGPGGACRKTGSTAARRPFPTVELAAPY